MKQQLRPYQLEAVTKIREGIRTHKRVLYSLPTGGGKTTIIADIVEKATAKGSRVLILVHRLELCEQVRSRLRQFNIETGIIVGGRIKNLQIPIQVATVQTFSRRVKMEHYRKFDLIIIDEAHRSASDGYLSILRRFDVPVIGFTATPYRTDSRTLREVFNHLITGVTVAQMIKQGYLVPTVVYAEKIDLSGVEIKRGDYDEKQLMERMDQGKIYDGVINKYRRYSNGTAICFCINKQHAENTAQAFNSAGIPAGFIYSGLSDTERIKALKDFQSGKIKVLCNVFILTEGYDLPRIDTVILNRATQSRIAWRQMIGRGLRPYPGKENCKVIDMGNNTAVHGFVEEDDEITLKLAGETKAEKKKRIEEAQTKDCLKCGAAVSSRVLLCPFCGYDFTVEKVLGEVEFAQYSYFDRPKVSEVWGDIPTEMLLEYADSKRTKTGKKYSKFWVLKQLEHRGLITLEYLPDGRVDLKQRTVKWWVAHAIKQEKQAQRILSKVS